MLTCQATQRDVQKTFRTAWGMDCRKLFPVAQLKSSCAAIGSLNPNLLTGYLGRGEVLIFRIDALGNLAGTSEDGVSCQWLVLVVCSNVVCGL